MEKGFEKGELEDVLSILRHSTNLKKILGHFGEDVCKPILEKLPKETSKNQELGKIYEVLFFPSSTSIDFLTVYFEDYFLLKDKKYLTKYLIIEFFVRRRLNIRKYVSRHLEEMHKNETGNCFIQFYHSLFTNYDFKNILKIVEECCNSIRSNVFCGEKGGPSEMFTKNAKFFMLNIFVKTNSPKSFPVMFQNHLKKKENELIALNMFSSNKMKAKYVKEEGKDEELKFSQWPNVGNQWLKSIMAVNHYNKLLSLHNKVLKQTQ